MPVATAAMQYMPEIVINQDLMDSLTGACEAGMGPPISFWGRGIVRARVGRRTPLDGTRRCPTPKMCARRETVALALAR